jgi:hypothetical protein
MNFLKIGMAVLAGFALGIVLFRAPAMKAQEAGNVMVFIHPISVLDQKMPIDAAITGSRVDGISCIPKPIAKLPDAAICYVATTN